MKEFIAYVVYDGLPLPQIYWRHKDAVQDHPGKPVFRANLQVDETPVAANGRKLKKAGA
jgi:hypothetical protein